MKLHPQQPELFDLGQLEREAVAATAWAGVAPLGYTAEFFDPVDLRAAFDRYVAEHGSFGCRIRSHMWVDHFTDREFTFGGHEFVLMDNDGGYECPPDHVHDVDSLPGTLMYPAISWRGEADQIAEAERVVPPVGVRREAHPAGLAPPNLHAPSP